MAEEKKIIVDEDWKTQVQAEKARAEQEKSTGAAPAGPTGAAGTAPGEPSMPPASFDMLLTTLATEAMIAMGHVPHPVTGQQAAQPEQARYLIDTIEMLQEKTKGNLSAAEAQAIESLLHQLRLAYVACTTPVAPPPGAAG